MTRRQGLVILAALLFWEEYARSKLVEANIGFVGVYQGACGLGGLGMPGRFCLSELVISGWGLGINRSG